jgi:hypothetical protein
VQVVTDLYDREVEVPTALAMIRNPGDGGQPALDHQAGRPASFTVAQRTREIGLRIAPEPARAGCPRHFPR